MNIFWLIAGIFILISGLVHGTLGELWLFASLTDDRLESHYTGEVTRIILRWFWHFGTFMIVAVAALTLTMALTNGIIPAETFVARLIAGMYGGLLLILALFTLPKPHTLKEFPQALLMVFFVVMLLWGAG